MAKKVIEQEGVSTDAPVKKTVKKGSKTKVDSTLAVIIGIGKLSVVASIAYSASVIVLGTEGIVPIVLIAPMAIYALVLLIKQFIK